MSTSTETEQPIDIVRQGLMAAMGGMDNRSETMATVDEQIAVCDRELKEVPERAAQRGPEFMEEAKAPLQDLLEALEAYKAWLGVARDGLENDDSSALVSAYEESSDILPQLSSALQAYSRFFTSYGSCQSGAGNHLARIIEGVTCKEITAAGWEHYLNYFLRGIEEMKGRSQDVKLPGRTALGERLDAAKSAIEFLKTKEGTEPEVKTKLGAFDDGIFMAEKIEKVMADSQQGPAGIPATDVLLVFLDKSQAGEFDRDLLLSCVEDYSEIIDDFAETFENSVALSSDSALVQEEIPRTLDTMDSHYSALEALEEALENNETDGIEEAKKKLLSTCSDLAQSREVFETAAQHQNHTLCPSCGRSNPPENRVCEACGDTLPRAEDPSALTSSTFSVLASPALEENEQLELSEHVAHLFNSCDAVADGTITHEQFAQELLYAAEGLKEFEEELDGVAATAMDPENFGEEDFEYWKETHMPYLEDVGMAFVNGMTSCQEGLQSMEQYLADPNEAFLVDGVRLVWEGLQVIHRGHLSLETYTKMLTDALDEAAEDGFVAEG